MTDTEQSNSEFRSLKPPRTYIVLELLVTGAAPVPVGRACTGACTGPEALSQVTPAHNPARTPLYFPPILVWTRASRFTQASPCADSGCLVIGSIKILNIFEHLLYVFTL